MKELSVFVDESGDFGTYDKRTPYYILSLVLHDQSIDITEDLMALEREMTNIGYPDHCIHVGPIIRKENEYEYEDLETRIKIVKRLMSFVRHIDVKFLSVYIEKKNAEDSLQAVSQLSRELSRQIKDAMDFFQSYDEVKVYYDNGQTEVNKVISSVFNSLLDKVEFRRVVPAEYRLFQVADLVCTMKLAELKMHNKALSNSEQLFFGDERTLKKNYLKPIESKSL